MSDEMRQTPLFSTHVSLGGRIVPFAGWEMPVQYAGILDEARAVRTRAGLFDVSHMGRVDIRGPGAGSFLGRILSVDVQALRTGSARYNLICNLEGGIIDDCIVYRLGDERYLLVPNASNTAAVLEWLAEWAPPDGRVRIDDVTSASAMIAHQGPQAVEMLSHLTSTEVAAVRRFSAVEATIAGAEALLARTGYTGEDGFELVIPGGAAPEVWAALMDRGAVPCGLGARDVLRLEAGLLLHGNDMDASVNPYEAGLARFVDPDREEYAAGEALRRIRDRGPARELVGFRMRSRRIPRHGYPITDGGRQIGEVTSGGYSPTLDTSVGLGYVPTGRSPVGARLSIDLRGRLEDADVVALPFYSRRRSA